MIVRHIFIELDNDMTWVKSDQQKLKLKPDSVAFLRSDK